MTRIQVDELQHQQRQLAILDKEIDRWFSDGKEAELERGQQRVNHLEQMKITLDNRKAEIQKLVSDLRITLMNCENEERNLRNNLKLIQNQTEKEEIVRALQELKRSLDGYQIQNLTREIRRLEEQLDNCKLKVTCNNWTKR